MSAICFESCTDTCSVSKSSEIYFNLTWLSWTLCLTGQEPWRCCVIFKTSIRSFQLLINRLQPPTYPSFYQRMLLLQISAIDCPIKCWKILKCKRYLQHDDDWPGTVQMLILPLFSPRVPPSASRSALPVPAFIATNTFAPCHCKYIGSMRGNTFDNGVNVFCWIAYFDLFPCFRWWHSLVTMAVLYGNPALFFSSRCHSQSRNQPSPAKSPWF